MLRQAASRKSLERDEYDDSSSMITGPNIRLSNIKNQPTNLLIRDMHASQRGSNLFTGSVLQSSGSQIIEQSPPPINSETPHHLRAKKSIDSFASSALLKSMGQDRKRVDHLVRRRKSGMTFY